MKDNYTHIAVLLDRTGSMASIRDDTIGGFNAFLATQQAEPGTATLTLVQFDTQDPYEVVHRFRPIQEVPALTRETYVPRASTPLLDAMGRGITDLEASLAALADADRPSRVVMVVITDGQENSSREFSRSQVLAMVKDKTDNAGWQFVFLSADLAAIGDAQAVGFAASSSLAFQKDAGGTAQAFEALSSRLSEYRQASRERMEFEDSDRAHPDDPAKKPEKKPGKKPH